MTQQLILDGQLAEDSYTDISGENEIPANGAIIVSLEQWQAHGDELAARAEPLGLRLKSDQHPEAIAADTGHFALIALEFPAFRDGRAYSYARLLRDRYGFDGELRAVGDVLIDQLHFMQRVGFNAFELSSDHPLDDYKAASAEFSAWYQPSADGRATAVKLRHL